MNRELLEKDFPAEMIKHRPGGYGKLLDYIEIANIIQRLNDAFDAQWSFEVADHIRTDTEVIVLGRLTVEGISKMQWGGSQVVKSTKTGNPVSLADDLKAAASDAIKKCASHFGVALAIYGRELPPEQPVSQKTNGTITPEQWKTLKTVRTELKMSPEQVIDLCEQMFKTREVTSLNQTQATTLVNALKMSEQRRDSQPNPDEPPF